MGRLTSENRPQRGQFLPDLQAHSPTMGQKDSEKWTAAADLQPTIPKADGLLARIGHERLTVEPAKAGRQPRATGRLGSLHQSLQLPA